MERLRQNDYGGTERSDALLQDGSMRVDIIKDCTAQNAQSANALPSYVET